MSGAVPLLETVLLLARVKTLRPVLPLLPALAQASGPALPLALVRVSGPALALLLALVQASGPALEQGLSGALGWARAAVPEEEEGIG